MGPATTRSAKRLPEAEHPTGQEVHLKNRRDSNLKTPSVYCLDKSCHRWLCSSAGDTWQLWLMPSPNSPHSSRTPYECQSAYQARSQHPSTILSIPINNPVNVVLPIPSRYGSVCHRRISNGHILVPTILSEWTKARQPKPQCCRKGDAAESHHIICHSPKLQTVLGGKTRPGHLREPRSVRHLSLPRHQLPGNPIRP